MALSEAQEARLARLHQLLIDNPELEYTDSVGSRGETIRFKEIHAQIDALEKQKAASSSVGISIHKLRR